MTSSLIIGADGTIGKALHARTGGMAITRTELDLSQDPANWNALPRADIAYLCAAVTKMDTCEDAPEQTHLVNVIHMQALADKLLAQGTFVVFLSTNQVFDGEKPYAKTTDATNPMNEYGKQKAEFESWLLPRGGAMLRLSKVVSGELPIIRQWKEKAARGETVEAFDDLVFAPLPLACAVEALVQIGEGKRNGISHLSGKRDISYFDIAQLATHGLAVPVSAHSKAIRAQFPPKHGTLESSHFEGIIVPEPQQVISADTGGRT